MSGGGREAIERLLAVIAASRPGAVAGWPAYWARLAGLPETEAAAALEGLAARGVVRRVPLAGGVLYVADPPHAPRG
jgi:hypothetical protein